VKLPAIFLLLLAALSAAGSLQIFGHEWTVPNPADWKVEQEGDTPVLRLLVGREPLPGPRRPFQFALANTPDLADVTLEADVRPTKRSLILVFAYRDPAHFDYAHLSSDTATKQPVHNGIFHVFGGERVRISAVNGPAAFDEINKWYHARLEFHPASGLIQVQVDGKPIPALRAYDLSLGNGKVGIGSFNETADFKNVKLLGGLPVKSL
jgi:hypothetical protein